jgi:hypothetical protein
MISFKNKKNKIGVDVQSHFTHHLDDLADGSARDNDGS